jgi:hypothetical protein
MSFSPVENNADDDKEAGELELPNALQSSFLLAALHLPLELVLGFFGAPLENRWTVTASCSAVRCQRGSSISCT